MTVVKQKFPYTRDEDCEVMDALLDTASRIYERLRDGPNTYEDGLVEKVKAAIVSKNKTHLALLVCLYSQTLFLIEDRIVVEKTLALLKYHLFEGQLNYQKEGEVDASHS